MLNLKRHRSWRRRRSGREAFSGVIRDFSGEGGIVRVEPADSSELRRCRRRNRGYFKLEEEEEKRFLLAN